MRLCHQLRVVAFHCFLDALASKLVRGFEIEGAFIPYVGDKGGPLFHGVNDLTHIAV